MHVGSLIKALAGCMKKLLSSTPQPLYNTVAGMQSRNRVSNTTVLYPNKNV